MRALRNPRPIRRAPAVPVLETERPPAPQVLPLHEVDGTLLVTAAILLAAGLVSVFSAGEIRAERLFEDPFHFVKRQGLSMILGLFVGYAALRVPTSFWRRVTGPFCAATFVALVLVLIPGIGHEVAGGRRWIALPLGFRFQPSEFARLAAVLWSAAVASGVDERRGMELPAIAKALGMPLAMAGLILLEPDFDAAVTPVLGAAAVLFVMGLPWRYLFAAAAAAVPAVAGLVWIAPYRLKRVTSFLDPFADAEGSGFQILQSFTALGSGGVFGKGLGHGLAKYGFLPEPQTDFVFAAIGEEIGFVGTAPLLLLYAALLHRGFRIARSLALPFDRALAAGITTNLAVQVALNLLVVTGLVPTTGLVLPLFSYGGSSLLFALLSLGILAGLSRRVA